tara:strand:+ start:198 stop:617 length:420 start_codon:yes stop_codon:yes gene_type:complete
MITDKILSVIDHLGEKGLTDESLFLDKMAKIILEKESSAEEVVVFGDYKSSILYKELDSNRSGFVGVANITESEENIGAKYEISFKRSAPGIESVSFYRNNLNGSQANSWTLELPVANSSLSSSFEILKKEVKERLLGK